MNANGIISATDAALIKSNVGIALLQNEPRIRFSAQEMVQECQFPRRRTCRAYVKFSVMNPESQQAKWHPSST